MRTYTLISSTGSSDFVTDFPLLQLATTISWQVPSLLLGFSFYASFLATEGNPPVASLVIGNDQIRLSIGQNISALATLLGNNFVGSPTQFVTPPSINLFFDEDTAIAIPAKSPVSIYVCSTATRTQPQAIRTTANLYVLQ